MKAPARETEKYGSTSEPAFTAECASVESAKPREGRGEEKMRNGKFRLVSIARRSHATASSDAEVVLRNARVGQPDIGHRVGRTEAQRLVNMSLCVSGSPGKDLSQSDRAVGVGEISIQRQRMLTFSDALRGAPGVDLDNA